MEIVENQQHVIADVPARPVRRSFFRDVPWRWRDVLFTFAPSVIFIPVRRVLPLNILFWLQWLWLPSLLLGQTWLIGATFWAARKRQAAPPGLPSMRRVLAELPWALMLVPAAFAAMIAVYSLASLVLEGAGPPSEGWCEPPDWRAARELVGFAIIALCVGPLAEELAYRGLLYNKLRQALPASFALLLQAGAFGLAHYSFGIAFAFATGAVALVIGLFYEWRKTLVACVLLHASANAVGLAMIMASVAADADSPRLGVYVVAGEQGCVVTGLDAGSTADRAGFRAGDVVTALDGTAVGSYQEFVAMIHRKRIGDSLTIDFTRAGKPQRVDVVLTQSVAGEKVKARGNDHVRPANE